MQRSWGRSERAGDSVFKWEDVARAKSGGRLTWKKWRGQKGTGLWALLWGSGRIWSRGGVVESVVTPDAAAAEQGVGRQGAGLEVSTRNPSERWHRKREGTMGGLAIWAGASPGPGDGSGLAWTMRQKLGNARRGSGNAKSTSVGTVGLTGTLEEVR